jgi:hypothetical protein
MRKIYKKLIVEQKARNIIFSSCLSTQRYELLNDTIHEVLSTDTDKNETIARLKDDKFFNNSHFKFNIIRT